MTNSINYPINLKYVLIVLVSVFLTTIFHELAHWGVGEALGNKMTLSLNSANSVSGNLLNEWNRNYISGAGPAFTVLQAIIFYFLIVRYKRIEMYPFVFFPFFMRIAAGFANLLGPNDEGRIGLSLGIGLMTISILVCSFLFLIVFKSSKKLQINWKYNIISFILSCLFFLLLTYVDAKFKIKII